ncbi:hypothetical protein [Zavarzinia aquatilis]|nr:hypothetical protein [Zavarzinia aquatilis]
MSGPLFVEGLLRLIGAFYVFAGLVALRAAVFGGFLDRALATLSAKPVPRAERLRRHWLTAAPIPIALGGAALLLLWQGALVFFIVNALGQALYLGLVAPRWLDPDDPPEPAGRRSTWWAFAVYLAATLAVLSAAQTGVLLPLDAIPPAALGGIGFGLVVAFGFLLRPLLARPSPALEPAEATPPPAHLILTPGWRGTGLVDAADGRPWEYWAMTDHVPDELQDRLRAWCQLFADHADPDDPWRAALRDPAAQEAITAMGAELLADLAPGLPGIAIDFVPVARPVASRWPDASRVTLRPRSLSWPLQIPAPEEGDEQREREFDPADFGLSHSLAEDLMAWNIAYEEAIPDLETGSEPVWSDEARAAFNAEGQALATRLRRELDATGQDRVAVETVLP